MSIKILYLNLIKVSDYMYQSNIKKELRKHGCHVWQLCDVLGISRDHYYQLSHHQFKGHEKTVERGLNAVIDNQKAGAVHAN